MRCVCDNSLQLCDPKDCGPPGSSVHGILQARTLEWLAMPSCRGSSQPRDRTRISHVSSLAGWFFSPGATREAPAPSAHTFLMFSSTWVQRLCSHCPGPQVTRPPTWLPWPRAAPGVSPARSVLAPPAACPLPVPPQADGKGQCGPQSRHKTRACRRPARPPGSLGAPGESVCGQGCCRTTLNLRNPTPGPPLLRASHPQRLMYDISPLHSPRCTMPGSRMNG